MTDAGVMPHSPLEGNRPELNIKLHDGTEEQVSIIIVHKDRPEYLNIALQSIAVTSCNNNYEIVVVDNGSGKDSQDFLDDIEKEAKVVRCEKNLFWAEAANKGVEAADKGSKYFIFLHCDVVVLNPAWLDMLINVSESAHTGMVGVEMQSYYLQQYKADFVQEWCLLMTRECFEAIGPWPPELPQIGGAFIMTVRAQKKGFKPQIMSNTIAHHYKIFSLDINQYEKLSESALVTLPKLLREAQA